MLQAVLRKKLPIDQLIDDHFSRLSPQDYSFAKAVALTTFRHMGEIDFLIKSYMQRPFDKKTIELYLLRTGLAQLLFMDSVSDHAAINETVESAKKLKRTKTAGVINGVMRKAQREGQDLLKEKNTADKNIPQWLKERLQHDYGKVKAKTIFPAMMTEAGLDIRLRDFSLADDYAQIGEKQKTSSETYRIQEGIAATDLPAWDEGKVIVQDAVAQIPARLLKPLQAEGKVVDACSAPGGKTVQLCDYLPKHNIIAGDINPKRLKRVEENLKRCQVQAEVKELDATKEMPKNSVAAFLLDVPCSATGTTRRNPDVLHTRSVAGVNELVELQKNILWSAAKSVKKDGIIIYSTCSLLKEEGETQIYEFLKCHPEFERLPIKPKELGGQDKWLNRHGDLRTTPDFGVDGFYAARLVRVK